jgi:peroxiredoxin
VSGMRGGDTGRVTMVRRWTAGRRPALAVLVALAALATGCSGGSDAVDQTAGTEFRFVAGTPKGQTIAAADRKPAPAVTGTLLDGGSFSLQSLRGQVVVLNFWAHWCGPCRSESPEFDRVYRETKADGVQFVGVNVKDGKAEAQAFVQDKEISYPSLFDPPGKVALRFRDFPPRALPDTIVIDRKGRVAAAYVSQLRGSEIAPVVRRLAEES